MMKIKIKKLSVFLIMSIILLIYFYYTKPSICLKSYAGIKCRINNDLYKEKVIVKLDGKYARAPFGFDTFEGDLYINNYTLKNIKLEFNRLNTAQIMYCDEDNNRLQQYGWITISNNIDNLIIKFPQEDISSMSKSWKYENGLIIAAPANTKEKALEIAEQLATKTR